MAIKYQDSQAAVFCQPDNLCSAAWIDRLREEKSELFQYRRIFFQKSEKKCLACEFENNSL